MEKLQEDFNKGIKPELQSFLDKLPDSLPGARKSDQKYTKDKSGLIDYIYDEFQQGNVPWEKELFRYNYQINDQSLKYYGFLRDTNIYKNSMLK